MQQPGFQEAVESICRSNTRYHPEAYSFLRDALEATIKRRKKTRKETGPHVGAEELLDGFRLHALEEFGPMALVVLQYWGVRATEDVGNLVFALVDAGVFGKTEEDDIEGFRGVYEFEEVFAEPFRPSSPSLNAGASARVFTEL